MAAKLTVKTPHAFGRRIYLGGWLLCDVYRISGAKGTGRYFKYALTNDDVTESKPYQSIEDCEQDAESEVRRLLKEAGVTLEAATETEALQAAWAALDALPNYLKQATEAGTALHNIGVILAERGVKP